MKTTSGAFSCIGYYSADELKKRLDTFVENGDIYNYGFLYHQGYFDGVLQTERKEHYHIYVEPAKTIDIEHFVKAFEFIDFTENLLLNSEKKCYLARNEINKSKSVVDWLAYSLHDKQYCDYKRLTKPYYNIPIDTIVSNNELYFKAVYINFPRELWESDWEKCERAIKSGLTFGEFAKSERLSVGQMSSWYKLWVHQQRQFYNDIAKVTDSVTKKVNEIFESR